MRVQGKVNGDVDDAENQGMPKEAVLVRRAREGGGSEGGGVRFGKGGRQISGMGWLARDPRRDGSGSSAGAGPGVTMGVAGVSEGVGVDARRWVEGLLSLNR